MHGPTIHELPPPPPGKQGWPWTEESLQLPDRMPNGKSWPLLSIVTPSYNQVQFLEETIRSVLLQGYPNLEYIVVDGGSIDGSVDIIRRYEEWLAGWVSEPDSGQSEAINKGWDRTKGDFVAWLNSDDTYCPGALAQVVASLVAKDDLGLVHGDCNCVDPSGTQLGILRSGPMVLRRQMTGRNSLLQPSTFFKRYILDAVGGLDIGLHYVMDYDLWVRMLVTGCTTHYIPIVLSNYRIHGSAKSIAEQSQMRREIKIVLDNIYKSHALPTHFRKWEKTAYSNYHQSVGESHFIARQKNLARREFWQAIRLHPMRAATVITLAYIFDTWLGTQFGSSLQRFRWQLPDVSRGQVLWDDLMKSSWQ